jgi:hypothetical protein
MADELLEVRDFGGTRLQSARAKSIVLKFLDPMALSMYFGIEKSDLVPDCKRCSGASFLSRSIDHDIALFCGQMDIVDV